MKNAQSADAHGIIPAGIRNTDFAGGQMQCHQTSQKQYSNNLQNFLRNLCVLLNNTRNTLSA